MFVTLNDDPFTHQTTKVICVGRNYSEHAKELNNPIPKEPLFFIKPPSTLCDFSDQLSLPKGLGSVHLETELAVLIGDNLDADATLETCEQAMVGLGLALDLTLRDIQTTLKQQGHPWERAKAFPNSCPVSAFVARPHDGDQPLAWGNLQFQLLLNGNLQQRGRVADMLFSVSELVQQAAHVFSLSPGDIILTGTPKGVGALNEGDHLEASLWAKNAVASTKLIQTSADVVE